MITKPWLHNGSTYCTNADGQRICTGSQMGRRNCLPEDPAQPQKLRMERLRFVDGCYDQGGAYWGAPENLWCAYNGEAEVYVRAGSRAEAKAKVRTVIPNARFYR